MFVINNTLKNLPPLNLKFKHKNTIDQDNMFFQMPSSNSKALLIILNAYINILPFSWITSCFFYPPLAVQYLGQIKAVVPTP